MEHFEDRHDGRHRVDKAAVWTATAGALVCSAVVFLATNWPSPDPVAEPIPSAEWRFPLTPSATVDTVPPGSTFDAVVPPQGDPTATSLPRLGTSTTTTTRTVPGPQPTAAAPGSGLTAPQTAAKQVRGVGAGKCLDVPNSTTAPGTQLQVWDCSGRPNQAWTLTPSGQLTVTLGGAARCMDAYGRGTSPGTQVTIWTCNGQSNQQWRVNPNGTITGVQSGLCLDVTGASTADGAKVELWSCNGQPNQRWTLA